MDETVAAEAAKTETVIATPPVEASQPIPEAAAIVEASEELKGSAI